MVTRGGWLVLIVLAGLTHLQAHTWTSDFTLWRHAVTVSPDKPRPWINYGGALEDRGDLEGAQWAYLEAVRGATLDRPPGVKTGAAVIAYTNLARVRWTLGDTHGARVYLDTALSIAPTYPHARVTRSLVCATDC